ncbi:MAG: AmmeMemoRadiSam system protein B [Thermoflexus sp.]|nr:AmmeMemoRadiSam system protein B [Thermoflexus sp.]
MARGRMEVREPAVAGAFYPADPEALREMVDRLLEEAPRYDPEPAALIVPHAGYIYSGHVAAWGFKQLTGRSYDAVVVLGTNHVEPFFHEISVWPRGAWRTPLGEARIDEELADVLLSVGPPLRAVPEVHLEEHSIEVEIPFLQRLFPDLRFVPVMIGEPSLENIEALAAALARVLAGRRAVVIASSDLSHYPRDEHARQVDLSAIGAILSLDPELVRHTIAEWMARRIPGLATLMCGEGPVLTAMAYAKRIGATHASLLKYANSSDVPYGRKDHVVGYAAIRFAREPDPPLDEEDRRTLLKIAREAVEHAVRGKPMPELHVSSSALELPRACFVTLTKGGRLRGCRGEIWPRSGLADAVRRVAVLSALDDPRFPPVAAEELPYLAYEISVLSPLRPVERTEEIEVGRDGLFILAAGRTGLLLPQVPVEQGWDREAFLRALCRKAGLPEDAWQWPDARLFRFEAEVFG